MKRYKNFKTPKFKKKIETYKILSRDLNCIVAQRQGRSTSNGLPE